MDLGDIPLFAMLRGRLGYLSQRQQVIAQNVANADTPGFTPTDLKPFTIARPAASGQQAVAPARTSAANSAVTFLSSSPANSNFTPAS